MKKLAMLAFAVMFLTGFSLAQSYISGTGLTGIDKLGAHQNGGRGCTGCHAPHSGAAGGGGNKANNAVSIHDPYSGDDALWGQDVTPLIGYSLATGDGGGFVATLPGTLDTGDYTNATAVTSDYTVDNTENEATVGGLLFCLSCHDGNIAKGGMMTNVLYEKSISGFPTSLYGPNAIPTLLGNDGTTAGNYQNDHPIGLAANLGAVRVSGAFSISGTGTLAYNATAAAANIAGYTQFVSNYGAPLQGRMTLGVPTGTTDPAGAFLVCTSCHNPHTMYIASGTFSAGKGNYPTFFFLDMPYNPGSLTGVANGTKASSATQFCRQCHYSGAGGANESKGIFSVTTAY